jgi:hypothetical protein
MEKKLLIGILIGAIVVPLSVGAVSLITTSQLANGAVTNLKLAENSVSSSKLGTSSVTTGKLQNYAVTNLKLADNSISAEKLGTHSVTASKIADLDGPLSVGVGAYGIWARPVTVGGTDDPIIGIFSGVTPNATINATTGYETNAIRGRMLITASPLASTSQYGTKGQVRIKPAGNIAFTSTTGGGVVAGLHGYYEQSNESHTVTLTNGFHAGVNAAVETESGYTLGTNGVLAGVLVNSLMNSSATLTGDQYAGIYVRKQGSAVGFKYGLYLDTGSATTADIRLSSGPTISSGASNPASCVKGSIFLNTTSGQLNVCQTADTWTAK